MCVVSVPWLIRETCAHVCSVDGECIHAMPDVCARRRPPGRSCDMIRHEHVFQHRCCGQPTMGREHDESPCAGALEPALSVAMGCSHASTEPRALCRQPVLPRGARHELQRWPPPLTAARVEHEHDHIAVHGAIQPARSFSHRELRMHILPHLCHLAPTRRTRKFQPCRVRALPATAELHHRQPHLAPDGRHIEPEKPGPPYDGKKAASAMKVLVVMFGEEQRLVPQTR